jgi:hypothetical protein
LTVIVIGLPSGTSAAITVTGPDGFNQSVTATQTFPSVMPGTYTIAASSVTDGTSEYSPSPPSQTVTVNGNRSAQVMYSLATGNLAVSITGLGTSGTAAVTVTGPGGYSQAVARTTTLASLTPGSYTVTARDTAPPGGATHTASPATQPVTVVARQTAPANVSYSPPTTGPLNLNIAGLYLTQSTQTYPASVPLVVGRDAYLRVFVIANRTTVTADVPSVRVRFYHNLVAVDSALILNPQASAVPTAVDESSLSYTWNVSVPASLIQTGLSIQAEVDPANLVTEDNELDNLYPAVGTSVPTLQSVPTLRVTFVPILQVTNGLQGNVTSANKNSYLEVTRRMHPIGVMDAIVGPVYTTTRTLQADGQGWVELLQDLDLLVAADPQYCAAGRYCYGVVRVPYAGGVAGIAYISQGSAQARVALGWDKMPPDPMTDGSHSVVVAHELGHNWSRYHAPCGGPAQLDPSYPHADGSIGSYGLDVTTSSLKASSLSDIMGYCPSKWIGDYSYRGVMDYRQAHPLMISGGAGQGPQPSILVSGRIRDGELMLDPAFQVRTLPRLPGRPGPYSIQGQDLNGSNLFDLSFAPSEVADLPMKEAHFVFAVPLAPARAARLSRLRLAGQGREVVRQSVPGPTTDSLEVRRAGGNWVSVRWNATTHSVVMLRDPETGRVLSLARGGEARILTSKTELDVVLSDGVRSKQRRVRVIR